MGKSKSRCIICDTDKSEMWWKCCPVHCTEQGPDVVCASCVVEIHGVCMMQDCENLGVEAVQIKFGCFEGDEFKIYTDHARKVYFCEDHKGEILILERQL